MTKFEFIKTNCEIYKDEGFVWVDMSGVLNVYWGPMMGARQEDEAIYLTVKYLNREVKLEEKTYVGEALDKLGWLNMQEVGSDN